MSRKKVLMTVYLTPRQFEQLKQLKLKTRVPEAERIREGIDLVLAREADKLPAQLELGGAGK